MCFQLFGWRGETPRWVQTFLFSSNASNSQQAIDFSRKTTESHKQTGREETQGTTLRDRVIWWGKVLSSNGKLWSLTAGEWCVHACACACVRPFCVVCVHHTVTFTYEQVGHKYLHFSLWPQIIALMQLCLCVCLCTGVTYSSALMFRSLISLMCVCPWVLISVCACRYVDYTEGWTESAISKSAFFDSATRKELRMTSPAFFPSFLSLTAHYSIFPSSLPPPLCLQFKPGPRPRNIL